MVKEQRLLSGQLALQEAARQRLMYLKTSVLPQAEERFRRDTHVVHGVGKVQQAILDLEHYLHESAAPNEVSPKPTTLKPTRGMLGVQNPRLS